MASSCEISPQEEDIENEVLIAEIEKRPALYKKDLKEYSDVVIKKHLWLEVCERLFPDKWDRLTEWQKMETGNIVQKRWKNIRACFSRELRFQKSTESGKAVVKRRKYMYFDQMLFLLPLMDNQSTDNNAAQLEEEEETLIKIEIEGTQSTQATLPHRIKQKKPKLSYEDSLLKILQEKSVREHDPDTYFALSLVPILKELPTAEKLDAQIQILQVLKSKQPSSLVAHE